MKIKEAIEHCDEIINKMDNCECRKEHEELKEFLEELQEYKDTGLTPEQIRELKERDTEYFTKTSIFDHESVVCKCGNDIEKDSGFEFCPWCGQRLKWEE